MIGSAEEVVRRIREARGLGLLVADQGRLCLGPDVEAVSASPFAHLLRLRVSQRTGQDVFRVLLGMLLSEQGWVSEKSLMETGAVCAHSFLYSGPLAWLRGELKQLAQVPGVQVRRADGPTFYRLTDLARRFFEGDESHLAPASGAVLVQPNMQIVVSPGAPCGVLARLGRIAKLKSVDRVAVFVLDEPTVRRTAAEGWSAQDSMKMLESCAAHGVPTTVARALSDWARLRGSARLTVGAVMQTDLPIAEMRRILGDDVIVETLAPGWLRVEAHDAGLVEVRLRKAGVACTHFPGVSIRAVPKPEEDFDDDDYSEPSDVQNDPPKHDASLGQLGKVLIADARRAMHVPKFELD